MCIRRFVRYDILAALAIASIAAVGHTSDWPQYMRDACHTADARDERLRLPLRVTASVRLDDAVLTSPAVVAGRAYVVDQMGSAYCIDPQKASIEWKTDPPGASAVGGNTSSPCVSGGKMAYGTTIGRFCLLDANNGDVLKIVAMNQPILGAITAANDRFYLQTLDGVIQCLDADGELCWRFDPYADAPNEPGSRDKRQYSRGEVAVLGTIVFMRGNRWLRLAMAASALAILGSVCSLWDSGGGQGDWASQLRIERTAGSSASRQERAVEPVRGNPRPMRGRTISCCSISGCWRYQCSTCRRLPSRPTTCASKAAAPAALKLACRSAEDTRHSRPSR